MPPPAITFLFIDPATGNFDYHLGVNYIIAYLGSRGLYAEQFINRRPLSLLDAAHGILKNNPGAIGFTCFDTNCGLVKLLAGEIRRLHPGIPVIAGGPSATFSDKGLLEAVPEIDVCVRGEGEYAALELVERLRGGKSLDKIKGITYRKSGSIIRNEDRPLIKGPGGALAELDILPSPYLEKTVNPKYFSTHDTAIPVSTSRGCVQRCAYCNCAAMSQRTIRYHSVDRIIKELKAIELAAGSGMDFLVAFQDDTFTFSKRRAAALCKRIIKEGIKLKFAFHTRADRVDQELLELLYTAGGRTVKFGLESAVPRILYAMKKVRADYGKKSGFLPEKEFIKTLKTNVALAKNIGFSVTINAIFGFPVESLRDGAKTLRLISDLDVDSYAPSRLIIFPGTEVFNYLEIHKSARAKNRAPFKDTPIFFDYPYSEYNIDALPHLPNMRNRDHRSSYPFVEEALMGQASKARPAYPEYIILPRKNRSLQWAKDNLALQTKLLFMSELAGSSAQPKAPIKTTVRSLAKILPIIRNYWGKTSRKLRIGPIPTHHTHMFLKLSEFKSMAHKMPAGTAVIFDILDNTDVRELKALTASAANLPTGENALSNGILLDACRWTNACPALNMTRLMVDGDGNIKPCVRGCALGNINHPLKTIEKNIARIARKTEKKRGCKTCPARNRCSKCVFLGKISEKEYCSTIKHRPRIGKFLKSLKMLNFAVYLLGNRNTTTKV